MRETLQTSMTKSFFAIFIYNTVFSTFLVLPTATCTFNPLCSTAVGDVFRVQHIYSTRSTLVSISLTVRTCLRSFSLEVHSHQLRLHYDLTSPTPVLYLRFLFCIAFSCLLLLLLSLLFPLLFSVAPQLFVFLPPPSIFFSLPFQS